MSRYGLLAAFVLLMLVGSPVEAQSRSVFWQRWDVTIDDMSTRLNRFRVTESYDISFTGTFTYGTATIPSTNLDDISSVQVSQNGQPLASTCSFDPGTFCAQYGESSTEVRYEFRQPITNSTASFEITYIVDGALRVYEGGDQLWWTAIPSDHFGFSIGSSTITVQLPPGFAPRPEVDPVVTYGAPAEVSVNGTTVTAYATQQLTGNDYFEIRVQYPHDPAATKAAWQADFDARRDYEENTQPLINLAIIALALLIFLGGLMGIYGLWYTRGRDPHVGIVPQYLTEPPSSLPPAIVGTLLDEKADLRDVICTLIDLAHRGYLVIEADQQEGFLGIGSTSTFIFKRTDLPVDNLRPFEQRILKHLFPSGSLERSLASLKNKFYMHIPTLQNDLYESLVTDGLFTTSPNTTRSIWSGLGIVILVLTFIAGMTSLEFVDAISPTLICLPFALGIVGIFALIVGQHMPAKTRKGAEEAAKWNAFREYLLNLEKYTDMNHVSGRFDDFLAYAIAFGIDRSWVRRFSKLEGEPIPPWYYPVHHGGPYRHGYPAGTPVRRQDAGGSLFDPNDLARTDDAPFSLDTMSGDLAQGLESISSGLTEMLNSASRVMTSQPQQARTGSSGSWGRGGSSWSGGGFSGGGSSGGGSRGFG